MSADKDKEPKFTDGDGPGGPSDVETMNAPVKDAPQFSHVEDDGKRDEPLPGHEAEAAVDQLREVRVQRGSPEDPTPEATVTTEVPPVLKDQSTPVEKRDSKPTAKSAKS